MAGVVTVAIDAMGGDHGHASTVPACLQALQECPELRIVLVGDQAVLEPLLIDAPPRLRECIEILHTAEVVEMHEAPSLALRSKKRSSMRLAIESVRDGRAQACVSAGNTGALMAISSYCLSTIESIDRPAILARVPREGGTTLLLDAGANLEANSERLHQFALMGSAAARAFGMGERPRVGLLNVGVEENKGSDRIKAANDLLKQDPSLNYIGYVEGGDVFADRADVVVCDGFVGNVVVKTSEGMARFVLTRPLRVSGIAWIDSVLNWLARPLLRRLRDSLNPGRFNGASLVGVRGIVVKSHGGAGASEFRRAILLAVEEVERDLPTAIQHWLG